MKAFLVIVVIALMAMGLAPILRGQTNKKNKTSSASSGDADAPPPNSPKSSFLDKVKSKMAREKTKSAQAATAFSPVHQLNLSQPFVCRKREASDILAKYAKGGTTVIGLCGNPGMGKTTLANHIADKLLHRYPSAQFYIDLKGNSKHAVSSADAMAQVIHAFRPSAKLPNSPDDLAKLYLSVFHNQRAIVLLDNAESAGRVKSLLPPKNCLALVTSRSPLALPGMYSRKVETLSPEDIHALVLNLAPRVEYWINEIIKVCDDQPLVIGIVCRFLAKFVQIDPANFTAMLRVQKEQYVNPIKGNVPPGLAIALNVIYQCLAQKITLFWRRLLVFPGTFDPKAQEYVCEDVLSNGLRDLAECGLVSHHTDSDRYFLHELIREYLESRANKPELADAQSRHASYYLSTFAPPLNELFHRDNQGAREALYLFDLEWTNIQAAYAWAESMLDKDMGAAKLCSAFPESAFDLLKYRLRPPARIRLLETALRASKKTQDPDAEANHLWNLGTEYSSRGQFDRAIECLQQALEASKQQKDRKEEGKILRQLGFIYASLGNNVRAIELHQQELEVARVLNDKRNEGMALGNLGSAYLVSGETARAVELFQQGLTIARENGDRRSEGLALKNLADAKTGLKEFAAALDLCSSALEILQKIRDRHAEGWIYNKMGYLHAEMGKPETAVELLEKAVAIFGKIQDAQNEGDAVKNLGDVYVKTRKLNLAVERYKKALELFEKIQNKKAKAATLGRLAQAYMDSVDPDLTVQTYEAQLSIAREMTDRSAEGEILWSLSQALEKFGDRAKAVSRAEEAFKVFSETQNPSAALAEGKLKEWKAQNAPDSSS